VFVIPAKGCANRRVQKSKYIKDPSVSTGYITTGIAWSTPHAFLATAPGIQNVSENYSWPFH
jgi:hypothetical protein